MTQNIDAEFGFEDCEIRSISFDFPDIVIKIFDPEQFEFYTIRFRNVEFFSMDTNHVQNVVSKIFLFDNFNEALNCTFFMDYVGSRNLDAELRSSLSNYKICYFYPITGGDTIIVYSDLSNE